MLPFSSWAVIALLLPIIRTQTPPNFTPSCSGNLGVIYPNDIIIQPGSTIQSSSIKSSSQESGIFVNNLQIGALFLEPRIGSKKLDLYKRYIIFMIDPDVIEDGRATTILHWYHADLLMSPIDGELFNLTDSEAVYAGPTPPPGPYHRYIFLLFLQPPGYEFPECFSAVLPLTLLARRGFDIKQFMQVVGLSEPIAANYFSAVNTVLATSTRLATGTTMSSANCPVGTQTRERTRSGMGGLVGRTMCGA